MYFIQSQGYEYEAECVGLYQDNISTQLLIMNENFSSGKNTKHVEAKLFFIKVSVFDGKVKVIVCPAEEMWIDILTKPLLGMVFRIMQGELMNCPVTIKMKKK
jgi:hypothetical protein